MGIQKFQSRLREIYKYECDGQNNKLFLVDFNCFIHMSISDLNNSSCTGFSVHPSAAQLAERYSERIAASENDDEKMILLTIGNFLSHLHRIGYQPSDADIRVFLDGCSSINKNNEQRQRKVQRKLMQHPEKWDRQKISPGSDFMNALTKELKHALQTLQLKHFLSDAYEFDEAEFKIMKHLRKHNIADCTILSPDSDLIILSLIQKCLLDANITLVSVTRTTDCYQYSFRDISLLHS